MESDHSKQPQDLLEELCFGSESAEPNLLREASGDEVFSASEADLEAAPWVAFTGFYTQVTCTCNVATSGACC